MTDYAQRRAALHRLADTLSDSRAMAPLLERIVEDTGFTLTNARKREFEYPSLFLRNTGSARPCLARCGLSLSEREPLGRVACALPSNAPLYSLGKVLGPAYLMSNAVAFRLPSLLRRSGPYIHDLIRAHLPDVEFVDAQQTRGEAFLDAAVADPAIQAIVIFGEDGWLAPVRARAKQQGKKLIFEGPGNDPAIVFEGADLERAAAEIARGCLNNGGQSCSATKRVYVQDTVYATFLDSLIDHVSRARCGKPDDADVVVGPIWSERVKARIVAHARDAATHGAKYLYGDGCLDEDSIFRPCVVEAAPQLRMVLEETFYPIIPVVRFTQLDELTGYVDDSPYGLNACVFGECPPQFYKFLCMGHKDVRTDGHPIAPEFVDRIMTIGGFKNSALVDEWVYEDQSRDRTRSLTAREHAAHAAWSQDEAWDVRVRHVSKQGRFLLEKELSVQSERPVTS